MENIQTFLLGFLKKIERICNLEKAYEKKYQEILDHQMSIYSKVITINDLKQFYLAKLQGYLQDELQKGLDGKLQSLEPFLQELHEAYMEMKNTLKFLQILKNVINFFEIFYFYIFNMIFIIII